MYSTDINPIFGIIVIYELWTKKLILLITYIY